MFIRARAEAEQFRHGAIKPAERIRIIPLLFDLNLIVAWRAIARRSENRRRDPA